MPTWARDAGRLEVAASAALARADYLRTETTRDTVLRFDLGGLHVS